MENFLFHAHSGFRWLVVLMTLVAFAWLLTGMFQARPYNSTTHRVMTGWSSMVGIQWLLGLILFITWGTYQTYHWEHLVTGTAALFLAHIHMPFKKRHDMARYRAGLMVIVGVTVLIYVGVARLPQGWFG